MDCDKIAMLMSTILLQQLQTLGFTDYEAAVYLACLELGATKSRTIINNTRLPRSTVYKALKALEKRGLVVSYDQAKIKHFIAQQPEIWLKQEQEKLNTATSILPDLRSLYSSNKGRTTVEIYRGLPEIKRMYESFLTFDVKHYKVIGSEDGWMKADAKWFNDFAKRRHQAGIQLDIILEDSKEARYSQSHRAFGRTIKLLPSTYNSPLLRSDCSIFKDMVVFQNYGREMTSVMVKSKETADVLNTLFDLAWNSL